MSTPLSNVAILLLEPSHPGNIGAAARAMKNMGLSRLILVNPKQFPDSHATARASGADDLLEKAEVYDSLDEALKDFHCVIATSARSRHLDWPLLKPKEAAEKALSIAPNHPVCILFGREDSGLTNEELARAQFHVTIPTNPDFSSLNLAAAVQVLTYELYQHTQADTPMSQKDWASSKEVEGLITHGFSVAEKAGFFEKKQTRQLVQRLRRLVARAQLEPEEIHILRGVFSAIEKSWKAPS